MFGYHKYCLVVVRCCGLGCNLVGKSTDQNNLHWCTDSQCRHGPSRVGCSTCWCVTYDRTCSWSVAYYTVYSGWGIGHHADGHSRLLINVSGLIVSCRTWLPDVSLCLLLVSDLSLRLLLGLIFFRGGDDPFVAVESSALLAYYSTNCEHPTGCILRSPTA